jgi:hypothetical protein
MNNRALIREFYLKCESREIGGLVTYGEFVPETDTRVLAVDIQEELLDCGNYLIFMERKYPNLTPEIQRFRAKVILMYGESKELEELERTLGEEGTK